MLWYNNLSSPQTASEPDVNVIVHAHVYPGPGPGYHSIFSSGG